MQNTCFRLARRIFANQPAQDIPIPMICCINPLNSETYADCIEAACLSLRKGQAIAIPTDTIYGFATLIPHVKRLYDIKGRDFSKAIALSVPEPLDVKLLARSTISDDLLHELLPGPVTLVFDRTDVLPAFFNPHHSTVAIRVPNDTFVRDLTKELRVPLALTSANRSSEPSTLEPSEFSGLWSSLGLVVDAGRLPATDLSTLGSTIVDLTFEGTYSIQRNGSAFARTVEILKRHGLVER